MTLEFERGSNAVSATTGTIHWSGSNLLCTLKLTSKVNLCRLAETRWWKKKADFQMNSSPTLIITTTSPSLITKTPVSHTHTHTNNSASWLPAWMWLKIWFSQVWNYHPIKNILFLIPILPSLPGGCPCTSIHRNPNMNCWKHDLFIGWQEEGKKREEK